MKSKEITLCGLAAVRAQFAADAASIRRLFFDYPTGRKIGVLCQALARARKVYRCVEPTELEKIAGTIHHGGIVAVVSVPALRQPSEADLASWAKRREPLLLLDRVGNAHNLGAIARTAAFFGVPRLVLPDSAEAAQPNDAAYRVAEGGLTHVEVWQAPSLVQLVAQLRRAGYEVIGAATRGGRLDGKAARRGPVALVLGNEETGLADDLAAACTRLVTLPGSGKVESLNVSVAAAVLMWELIARQ